jgi:acetoin utilization protein AcuB
MIVKKWMTREVITVSPEEALEHVRQIFKKHKFRRVPVLDNNHLVGIISESDLRSYFLRDNGTAAEQKNLKLKAGDIMTGNVITISMYDTIEKAALLMQENKIGGLPVIDGDHLVGIITEHDVFDALIEVTGAKWGVPRLTLVIDDRPGSVKEVADIIRKYPAKILSFLITKYQMPTEKRELIMRVDSEKLPEIIRELEQHYGEVIVHQSS